MAHMIYVLNIDNFGISDEDLIGRVETTLYNDDTLKYQGIDCVFPAKEAEYILSDFKELESFLDQKLRMNLKTKVLKNVLLKRYLQAEIWLFKCLDTSVEGLMNLITAKPKIVDRLEGHGDAIFILPQKPEFFLGYGDFLDQLFLYCIAVRKEVKVRLIKGYKYYN